MNHTHTVPPRLWSKLVILGQSLAHLHKTQLSKRDDHISLGPVTGSAVLLNWSNLEDLSGSRSRVVLAGGTPEGIFSL
jgi:hypothetical protein